MCWGPPTPRGHSSDGISPELWTREPQAWASSPSASLCMGECLPLVSPEPGSSSALAIPSRFVLLDSSSTGCILGAAKLPPAPGSPISGQRPFALLARGQGKGWSCSTPLHRARLARRDDIFYYQPSTCPAQEMPLVSPRKRPRRVFLSRPQLGSSLPGAASTRAVLFLFLLLFFCPSTPEQGQQQLLL